MNFAPDITMGRAASIAAAAGQFSDEQIAARRESANALLRGLGVLREDGQHDGILSFDPVPLVIEPQEWAALQTGLVQRARALEALVRDAYSGARIVREGILPIPAILGYPGYLRECVGLRAPENTPARVMSFDLVQDKSGRWWVVRDRLSSPSGLACALQARRTQRQVFPEIFEADDVQPVAHFTTLLLENMLRVAPGGAEPDDMVLLSDPDSPLRNFEDNFLARKMGLRIANPQDLVVRDGTLAFRTITGLHRIGLAIRTLPGSALDPVALGGGGGVPGLMSCIRGGTAVVVNHPGCSVAENRALLAYNDQIVRFYTGGPPLLPAIRTQWLLDAERAIEVSERGHAYIVARADGKPMAPPDWQTIVGAGHASLVVHPRLQPALIPGEPARVLRCFALVNGDRVEVMQGGLSLVYPSDDFLNNRCAVLRDAWVLGDPIAPKAHFARPPAPATALRRVLGSGDAEALYWLGRYCERAECTARMVAALGEARLDTSIPGLDPWRPLWDAVCRVTGHGSLGESADFKNHIDAGTASHYLVLDSSHPASIASTLRSAHGNAAAIQDFISPEAWIVIHKLHSSLEYLAAHSRDTTTAARLAMDQTLNQLAAFHGMTARTMIHDVGSDFFMAGAHIERSLVTLGAAARVFADPDAFMGEEGDETDLENPILNTLLAMIGTMDAYRRKFQIRALPFPVLEILIKEPESPISATFCAMRMQRFLTVHTQQCKPGAEMAASLLGDIAAINFLGPDYAREPVAGIPAKIDAIHGAFERLHTLIGDAFFSHQMAARTLGDDL